MSDARFLYEQRTGRFFDSDNRLLATGYSGRDKAKNDPERESERGKGPIPRGDWRIGAPYDSRAVGPFALRLAPVGHDAHGRSAFLIHGDSRSKPGTASRGCIILPRRIREAVWASGVRLLRVVAG